MLDQLQSVLERILHPGETVIAASQLQPLFMATSPDHGRASAEIASVATVAAREPASAALNFAAVQSLVDDGTEPVCKLAAPTAPRGAIVNGAKLRKLRESQPEGQQSIEFIADCLGVTAETVNRAETQNRGGLATVVDYARLFNVAMDDLVLRQS